MLKNLDSMDVSTLGIRDIRSVVFEVCDLRFSPSEFWNLSYVPSNFGTRFVLSRFWTSGLSFSQFGDFYWSLSSRDIGSGPVRDSKSGSASNSLSREMTIAIANWSPLFNPFGSRNRTKGPNVARWGPPG